MLHWLSSHCGEWWLLSSCGAQASHCSGSACCGAPALRCTGCRSCDSPAPEHRPMVVAHGLSCSTACGIFPDQDLNLCLLHRQVNSLPLSHQGSLICLFLTSLFLQAAASNPSPSAALEWITTAGEEAATVMNSATWYQTAAQTTMPSASPGTHMQASFHPQES